MRSGVRCSSVVRPAFEQRVDDDPLGRREHDRLDELLALDTPAVAAHELHPRAGQRDVEHAGVRRVRQVEANDLALPTANDGSVSPATSMTLP